MGYHPTLDDRGFRPGSTLSAATLPPMETADGALLSTTRDLARLGDFLRGNPAFPNALREALALVATPHVERWKDSFYGYGCYVRTWNGQRMIGHGGDMPGFQCMLLALPEAHAAVTVALNGPGFPFGLCTEILGDLVPQFSPDTAATLGSASGSPSGSTCRERPMLGIAAPLPPEGDYSDGLTSLEIKALDSPRVEGAFRAEVGARAKGFASPLFPLWRQDDDDQTRFWCDLPGFECLPFDWIANSESSAGNDTNNDSETSGLLKWGPRVFSMGAVQLPRTRTRDPREGHFRCVSAFRPACLYAWLEEGDVVVHVPGGLSTDPNERRFAPVSDSIFEEREDAGRLVFGEMLLGFFQRLELDGVSYSRVAFDFFSNETEPALL